MYDVFVSLPVLFDFWSITLTLFQSVAWFLPHMWSVISNSFHMIAALDFSALLMQLHTHTYVHYKHLIVQRKAWNWGAEALPHASNTVASGDNRPWQVIDPEF